MTPPRTRAKLGWHETLSPRPHGSGARGCGHGVRSLGYLALREGQPQPALDDETEGLDGGQRDNEVEAIKRAGQDITNNNFNE